MTLRIERRLDGQVTVLTLIGRIQVESVPELQDQLQNGSAANTALDLGEVTLVDVDVVRFLGQCEASGIELRRCPRYIREWISRESH